MIKKYLRSYFTAIALCVAAGSVNAVPIEYEITFSGTTAPSGTGSFSWDESTSLFSEFSLVFDGGHTGIVDANSISSPEILAEILFLQDLSPSTSCDQIGPACGHGGFNITSSSIDYLTFFSESDNSQTYQLWANGNTYTVGFFSITQASVPEPTSIAIFTIGLIGLGLSKKAINARKFQL